MCSIKWHLIDRWTTWRVLWLNIGYIRIYLLYVFCSKSINRVRERGKKSAICWICEKKNMREKRIMWPKILYFGNDIAEIGERWEKKIVWFWQWYCSKMREEIEKKIVCILAKLVEEERGKNFYLFVLLEFFLIFQKFIPLFYSAQI